MILGGGATALTSGIITVVGFTKGGIGAGTLAAAIQSGIGNVAAGSTFAALQSAGATGLVATVGTVGASVAVVGVAGYGGYKVYKHV